MAIPPPPPEESVFGPGVPPPPPEEAIFGAPAAPSMMERIVSAARQNMPPPRLGLPAVPEAVPEAIAKGGRWLQSQNEGLGELLSRAMSEHFGVETKLPGDMFSKATGMLTPQTKTEAAMLPLMGLGGATSVGKGLGEIDAAMAKAVPEVAESVGTAVPVKGVTKVPILDEVKAVAAKFRDEGQAAIQNMSERELELFRKFEEPIRNATQHNVPLQAVIPDAAREVETVTMKDVPPQLEKVAEKIPPKFRQTFVRDLISGMSKVPKNDVQYALEHPEILKEGPSIEQATDAYVKALPKGVMGKVRSIGSRLNKTVIGPADYDEAINRAGRLLDGTEINEMGQKVSMTAQDALEGLQTINERLRLKADTQALTAGQKEAILARKDQLLGFLEQNGAPDLRSAAKGLREAYVREGFNSWFPRNKYGGVDALRTFLAGHKLMSGLGAAGAVAATAAAGPIAAVPLAAGAIGGAAAMAPKTWGTAIRAADAIAPAVKGLAASPEVAKAIPLSLASLLRANVLNPQKSGDNADAIRALNLPKDMAGNHGKADLSDIARALHQAGVIPDEDEQQALDYIKKNNPRRPK